MLYSNKAHKSQLTKVADTEQHFILIGKYYKPKYLKEPLTTELRIHCGDKGFAIMEGENRQTSVGSTRSNQPKFIIGDYNTHLLIDTNIVNTANPHPPVNGHVNIIPLVPNMGIQLKVEEYPTKAKIIQQGSISNQLSINKSYLIEYNSDYLYEIVYSPDYITYIYPCTKVGANEYHDFVEETFTQITNRIEQDELRHFNIYKWHELQLDMRLKLFAKVGKL